MLNSSECRGGKGEMCLGSMDAEGRTKFIAIVRNIVYKIATKLSSRGDEI
jgi:hypothetical protein